MSPRAGECWSCSPGDARPAVPCAEGRARQVRVDTGWAVMGGEGCEGAAVGQEGQKERGQAWALGELQRESGSWTG